MDEQLLLPTPKTESGRQPTGRQLQAVENLVENGGNKGKAIRKAGYSGAMAKTPDKVFGSPTIKQLLTNARLDEVHAFRILSKKLYSENERIQIQALDMVFKLNGSYAPKKVEGKHTVGHFSLSGLRKKMDEHGFSIIDHEK